MSEKLLTGEIEEIEKQAEAILVAVVGPEAFCQAQEWDERIDCCVKLSDGSVVAEMVSLSKATEARIRETAERLRQRKLGIQVPLVDELLPPIWIGGPRRVETLKVQALRSGQITVDGKPSTLADLKTHLAKIKFQNGVVFYYRDDPGREPTREQWAAFVAIADARVVLKMFAKADFSDNVGPIGTPP